MSNRNIAASARAILLNKARATKQDFSLALGVDEHMIRSEKQLLQGYSGGTVHLRGWLDGLKIMLPKAVFKTFAKEP